MLPKGFSLDAKIEFAAGEDPKLDGTTAAARLAMSLGATGKYVQFDIEQGIVKRASGKRQLMRKERPCRLLVATPRPDSHCPILAISLRGSDEGRKRRLAVERAFYAVYRSGLTWVDAVTPKGVHSWHSNLHRANP